MLIESAARLEKASAVPASASSVYELTTVENPNQPSKEASPFTNHFTDALECLSIPDCTVPPPIIQHKTSNLSPMLRVKSKTSQNSLNLQIMPAEVESTKPPRSADVEMDRTTLKEETITAMLNADERSYMAKANEFDVASDAGIPGPTSNSQQNLGINEETLNAVTGEIDDRTKHSSEEAINESSTENQASSVAPPLDTGSAEEQSGPAQRDISRIHHGENEKAGRKNSLGSFDENSKPQLKSHLSVTSLPEFGREAMISPTHHAHVKGLVKSIDIINQG